MHGFLLLGGLLLPPVPARHSWTVSEMPDGKDPARQEILLNINNKLVLHKTDTGAPLPPPGRTPLRWMSTFSAPTEDGTYFPGAVRLS